MRKLTNYFFIAIAAVTMVFTSCSDDEDPLGPSITFKSGEGLTTGDATVDAGDSVKFSLEANRGDAKLTSFEIRDADLDILFQDDNIDKDQYEAEFTFFVESAGEYVFSFIAVDKDGLEAVEKITITAQSDLVTQGEANLGAGGSSLGSYYSVEDGTDMNLAEAKASPGKVDIVFTSSDSEAKFISPKDAAAAELQNEGRTTLYTKASLDFETASSVEIGEVTLTDEEIVIASGDVIVFETEDGERGILEISALAVANDGTVTIEVKVKG